MAFAYCGLNCEVCSYREKMNCPGCQQCGGEMFWGKCEIAACCISKELENCGKCETFPCENLKKFAFDPEQGDNGKRIENLKSVQG